MNLLWYKQCGRWGGGSLPWPACRAPLRFSANKANLVKSISLSETHISNLMFFFVSNNVIHSQASWKRGKRSDCSRAWWDKEPGWLWALWKYYHDKWTVSGWLGRDHRRKKRDAEKECYQDRVGKKILIHDLHPGKVTAWYWDSPQSLQFWFSTYTPNSAFMQINKYFIQPNPNKYFFPQIKGLPKYVHLGVVNGAQ